MSKKRNAIDARVYSYIRFSTPEQAMGDSERRQVDGAKSFAERHKLALDDTLSLTDRGLSGYHGTHRKKGALGKFLIEVEAGNVPTGSILLVENIDRLSREGAVTTLRQILFKLWDHGITLATLSPEELYEPGCDNAPKFLALFLFMQRAQDESQRKSERITKARDQARINARESGKLLTSRMPAWLDAKRARKTGERVAIPEAVKTIKRIFQMKVDGISLQRIEQQLNDDATWKRQNGWRASYVRKLLTNRALIGEYQPFKKRDGIRKPDGDPIKGYYPVVIEPALFHSVQQTLSANKGKGGQTGKVNNLLTHVAKCAYCGGSMAYVDKGKKTWQYLVCDNGVRNHACQRHAMNYNEIIQVVLQNSVKLEPSKVLPNSDQRAEQANRLQQRIAGMTAELADIENQIENYVAQLGRSRSETLVARCEAAVDKLELQKTELLATVRDDEAKLRDAQRSLQTFKTWKRDLETLVSAVKQDDATDLRLKLRTHLRQFVTKVEVFADGDPEDDYYEVMEARAMEYYPDALQDDCFVGFMAHVAQLRQTSRLGRFVRVQYRGGAVVDLVPPGSLASGMELAQDARKRNGWRFVSPSLDRRWQDWKTAYNAR